MPPLDCVHSPEVLRTTYPVGARLPPSYGSTGKVLLAFRPFEVRETILTRHPLARGTPRAISRLADYRRELVRVRAAGYAVNFEEQVNGVRSVAAPILDGAETAIAAIGISFPAAALPRARVREVADRLRQDARQASVRLGYLPARRDDGGRP